MTHPTRQDGNETSPPSSSAQARYEIVFETGPRGKDVLRNAVAELKSITERSSVAVGRGYAKVASAVLRRVERLEDWNAERRSHLHLKRDTVPRRVPGKTTATTPIVSSAK
jgi:hypothetical protein